MTPDSWVLMGALAIATLAGASIAGAARHLEVIGWLVGMMGPATLAVWIFGTAWIPALLVGEVWRFTRSGAAPGYERSRWATVFPLGMYAAATYALAAEVVPAQSLERVSMAFFWAALLAWCLTSYGLIRAGRRKLRGA